jgi:ParB family chromosome partitioning protein
VTRDVTTIRNAARSALVEVLSCRENQSASGIRARYAGASIGADVFLPNMATEEFLPAMSRAALEQCAVANAVAPQARVKDTRAALVKQIGKGIFVFPRARFAPSEEEQEAQRQTVKSYAVDEADGNETAVGAGEIGEGDDNLAERTMPLTGDDHVEGLAAT